jgi:NAD(P)-dependent dehydrogenase (short-subunit alcohol dehydrogenase family)
MSGSRLAGKRALITGGAQGLGLAFGRQFLAEGAKVVLTDIQADKVSAAAEEIGAMAGLSHDVTEPARWREVAEQANEAMGGIDVLVHNAGIGSFGSVETESYDMYRKVMAIDCDAVFLGTQAALPYLKASAPAAIVVISSVAGLRAQANFLSYNTAKAAVAMMTKSIALHCAKAGYDITANSVHPVFTRTQIIEPMIAMKGSREEGEAALTRNVPLRRLGEPEEVANMVTYLASNEARFVTGAEFVIDGGLTA